MGQLVALKKLNLMENDLHALPGDFKNLKKLEDLDLRNNPLCTDKLGAGEWKKLIPHLSSLKQLRTGNTQPAALRIPSTPPGSEANLAESARGARTIPVLAHISTTGAPVPAVTPSGAPANPGPAAPTAGAKPSDKDKQPASIFTLFGEAPAGAPEPPQESPLSSTRKKAVNYQELLASLERGEAGLPGEAPEEPVAEPKTKSRSHKSKDSDALIKAFAVKEDMNEAGLKRGKKTAVTANPHGKGGFQMEDVNFAEYPFESDKHKALFCVFDGHAGVGAAEAAKRHVPPKIMQLVSESTGAAMPTDLSEILPVAFLLADEDMKTNEYEGTTATAVMIWQVGKDRYIQAANVGDSRAYLCREKGVVVPLTKDHKLAEEDERARMANCGFNVNEGQTRINGLAVTRALGDRFAKDSNSGMIAVPHVSDAIKLEKTDRFMILGSDGLWDIVSPNKAYEICQNEKDVDAAAQQLITTAVQSVKCQDNVTVIVVAL